MAPAYDPLQVEDGWYSWWVEQGLFKPQVVEVRDTCNISRILLILNVEIDQA